MQTAIINVRTDKKLKESVGRTLKSLGLDHSTAINMFYRAIKANKGIPFEIKIPNKETIQAMKDLETGKGVETFKNVKDMFKSWDDL